MPTTNSSLYRETVRRMLANRVGDSPDAKAIAKATLSIWHQVFTRLKPLIGPRGTNVLFARSLHLTGAAYPWLSMAVDHADSKDLLADIKTRLEDHAPDVARAASYALLTNFIDLLTTLIGESLTERLLDPVWAPYPTSSQKERVA
jgi:hypothetical protein